MFNKQVIKAKPRPTFNRILGQRDNQKQTNMEQKQIPITSKITAIISALLWTLVLCWFIYIVFSPNVWRERFLFRKLDAQPITSISIEPHEYSDYISEKMVITDAQDIRLISQSLKNLPTYAPNHPQSTRCFILRISIKDHKDIGGDICNSKNAGITFYNLSKVTTGFVYGSYRIPEDRRLFETIDAIKAKSNK